MSCKKHYTDPSSSIGVCACCLRERLLSLIAAQEQIQSHIQNLHGKHRSPENIPAFPRSLSPHFNRRKSDLSDVPRHHHNFSDQLFHRTPTTGGNSKKKRSFIRLLSFPNFFRSRNRKPVDSVSKPNASDSTFGKTCGGDSDTSSWFSSIISGGLRRRRKKKTVCINESTVTTGCGSVRRQQFRDRGMSPVRNRNPNVDVAGDEYELHNATSGYEPSESWKNTPRRTPAVKRGGSGGHVRNISGLTFCLSPLVRASPNLQRNQKGLPPDEIGGAVKPHLSHTKSFCANKSRKLVDFGRVNPNR